MDAVAKPLLIIIVNIHVLSLTINGALSNDIFTARYLATARIMDIANPVIIIPISSNTELHLQRQIGTSS